MDRVEQIARDDLESVRSTNIVYEPDGDIPPDFLGDGRVAVEVRRPNQQESSSGKPRGLEETTIPIIRNLERILPTFGPAFDAHNWFVSSTSRVHSIARPNCLPAFAGISRSFWREDCRQTSTYRSRRTSTCCFAVVPGS